MQTCKCVSTRLLQWMKMRFFYLHALTCLNLIHIQVTLRACYVVKETDAVIRDMSPPGIRHSCRRTNAHRRLIYSKRMRETAFTSVLDQSKVWISVWGFWIKAAELSVQLFERGRALMWFLWACVSLFFFLSSLNLPMSLYLWRYTAWAWSV